ncbi:multisubstrate pseudouridine synthase 7 isoform X2 [Ziziphus jujuba]|uniref:Multisubstrate pseudouridine synthase 7 isoform X2 n=1 Tax=Ziziphus jujuba TaxID=326968 RepID=A0A6P3ZPB0_ZIZJJ|nr:multisubstrate pseudouridine synthase 7 isoform X2 [Ziziphus jujuba]
MWQRNVSSCLSALKPYFLLCNNATKSSRITFKTLTLMKTLDEKDVGIFCYISQLPGFRGILKQRYSDFIVNEVDWDGNVVHLSSLDAPPEAIEENGTEIDENVSKSYTTEIESFRCLAGDSDAGCLEAFINQICSGGKDSISPIVLSPDSDKSHRTAIHNFFKENFKFLVTDTVDGPDASSKCIRVRLNSGGWSNRGRNSKKRKERGDKPFDSRGSEDWQGKAGKFLRFHLYKENKDSQEALGLIGKMLGIKPRSFGFAGTKDKRAVSTQRVTVFKLRANRLAALNDRLIGIKVGDFCYVEEGLLLGQLLGNRFTITLRGVVADSEDTIKASASALGLGGFINYYGLQLQCLKKCPGNYLQALKTIPRTLRMMYVHSYQSYLWNHAASMRVQKYGTDKVVLGDLVYCKENDTEKVREVVNAEYEDEDCNDAFDSHDLDEISTTDIPNERTNLVKAVSAEDILNGGYTIDDVVLPLPGSRVIFPANDIAEVYHDLAKKDGISLTESVHNVKEFSITSMTGSYRRVFQKPLDYEWELLTYTDGTKPLAETDLDIIAKSKPAKQANKDPANGNGDGNLSNCIKESEHSVSDIELRTDDNDNVEGEKKVGLPQVESTRSTSSQEAQKALKLIFTLPASCYATMAIRELLKTSTSVAFHKTLNQ